MPKTLASFSDPTAEIGDYFDGYLLQDLEAKVWISGSEPVQPVDTGSQYSGTGLELVNFGSSTDPISPSAVVLGQAPHNLLQGYDVSTSGGIAFNFDLSQGTHEIKIWVKLTTGSRLNLSFFADSNITNLIWDIDAATFSPSAIANSGSNQIEEVEMVKTADAGTLAHLKLNLPVSTQVRFGSYVPDSSVVGEWAGAIAYEVIPPEESTTPRTLAIAQTNPSAGVAGYNSATKTFLFDSVSGDIPYDPATGLWTLEYIDVPRKFLLESFFSAIYLSSVDYADLNWYDEAGNLIDNEWTANGTAIGGNAGLMITPEYPSDHVSPLVGTAVITITSTVKARYSVNRIQGSFNVQQARSIQRITELPIGQIITPPVVTETVPVNPLSFALYTLAGDASAGSGNAPQGPVPRWEREDGGNVANITEVRGNGIEKWTLGVGRWKLAAQIRKLFSQQSGSTRWSWFNEKTAQPIGGEAFTFSLAFNTAHGATDELVALVEISEPTTFWIRQETGRSTSSVSRIGSWVTIEQLPTHTVINPPIEGSQDTATDNLPVLTYYTFTVSSEAHTNRQVFISDWADKISAGYKVFGMSWVVKTTGNFSIIPGEYLGSDDTYGGRLFLHETGNDAGWLAIFAKGVNIFGGEGRLTIHWNK